MDALVLLVDILFCISCQVHVAVKEVVKEVVSLPSPEFSTSVPDPDGSCDCPDDLVAAGARNCVCLWSYLCDDRKRVNRFGEGVIDSDYVKSSKKTSCPSLHWCCTLDNVTDAPFIPTNLKKTGCGRRQPDGVLFSARNDNTDEAAFGEFPWMIAVYEKYEGGTPKYPCGGTLIHPEAVITAARCVVNWKKKYIARAGDWDLQSSTEIFPSQDRIVKEITIHPHYHTHSLYNDIAFLLLESPFEMTNPNIGVACLPLQGTTFPNGARCLATGWSKDELGPEMNLVLKKIHVPIVGRNVCQRNLRTTRLGKNFTLKSSITCVGGKLDKDVCTGHNGAQLVCPIPKMKGRYQHVGLILTCRNDGIPNLLTDVALFRDWIDEQATRNNLDTSTYTY